MDEYENARKKIKRGIDRNAPYSIIIDETPDRWEDLNVTTLLYVADPRLKPKTLEIVLREASADNEGVSAIMIDARDHYELHRDLASTTVVFQIRDTHISS